jgi:hypothetical protein
VAKSNVFGSLYFALIHNKRYSKHSIDPSLDFAQNEQQILTSMKFNNCCGRNNILEQRWKER